MGRNRDDFTATTRSTLAGRVNYLCSQCFRHTLGPKADSNEVADMGTAAHITAAAPGGPRYDSSLSTDQRRHYDNGIWMCSHHGRLVDTDHEAYSVADLREMKRIAEDRARKALRDGEALPDLTPMLDSGIQWLPPRTGDHRSGYGNIHHAGIVIAGNRKERGHAYLQIDAATAIPLSAVIADEKSFRHHWRDLGPHVPYRVPALTITDRPGPVA